MEKFDKTAHYSNLTRHNACFSLSADVFSHHKSQNGTNHKTESASHYCTQKRAFSILRNAVKAI